MPLNSCTTTYRHQRKQFTCGKMSRKSKKRRCKKSSSSNEEDDKSSKKQDFTESYKRGKRKQDVKESCAAKPEKCEKSSCKKSSSSREDDEKSSKKQDFTENYKRGKRKHVKESCAAKPEKCEKSSCKKSSSSREEDEKSSKEQDVTENYKRGKRKHVKESCTAKPEKCAFSTVKDVSQSTRHIKSAVYRQSKTQATNPKHVYMQEECTKPKREISGKDNTVRCKTVEVSKPSNNAGTAPQRTEKTFKGSTDKTSSHSSTSNLKKQRMSPSLVSAEQKEQRPDVLKSKCRSTEPPRTGNEHWTVKTREPSKASSVSQDSSWEKKKELFKKMCKRLEENKAKRSLCTEAKTLSVPTTEHSSTSSKQTVSSSNVVKNAGNVPSMSSKTVKSSSVQQQICHHASLLPLRFKISKKVQPGPVYSPGNNNGASSSNTSLKHGTEPSDSRPSRSNAMQESVQQAPCCLDATPSSSSEGQDKKSFSSSLLPVTSHTLTEPWHDQMQVVEELHLARSEKRLEVNVLQIYGELTCMDIDPPEEGAADTQGEQPPQQDLILVLDTNILLSHLDYVKQISSHGLGAPVVLIPWVVLQELDSLKRGRGMSGSVAHLATPAISYIYNSLKNRGPHLWGQSMQQAVESSNGLNAENNDDRVLQCCLQYQGLYPECTLILCTNDKNLCCKALVSGVKALSKNDLEEEIGKSRHSFHPLGNIRSPMLPHVSPHLPSPMQSRRYTPAQPLSQERTGLSVEEKDNKQLSTREDEEKTKWSPSSVSELEDCLREVLSDVLEVEMKAAYEDLWLEIVYLKPPWTLQDVLQCLKKHWIAVFGQVVPRRKLQTVLNLIEFFNSGYTANCSTKSAALQQAKELVKVFGKSSRLVPSAISMMDNIYNKLQPQWEPPACDVVMNDNDEEKQPTPAQVSHQEVWALFENIWSHVYQISLEVFKALGFDPHTMQRPQPVGGPPPQDALVCLHRMSSMVSQLLQAFSSILSSAPGLEEAQALLAIIHSNKIVDMDSRLTAKDLLDCFSQQDYRDKLRNGGNQLMGVKEALDCCIGATGHHTTFPTSAP